MNSAQKVTQEQYRVKNWPSEPCAQPQLNMRAQAASMPRALGCVVVGSPQPCRSAHAHAPARCAMLAVPRAPCPTPLGTVPRAPASCRRRPNERPCAVSQDTPQLARLPMSQYSIVYCNTIFSSAAKPTFHPTVSRYSGYIVTQLLCPNGL